MCLSTPMHPRIHGPQRRRPAHCPIVPPPGQLNPKWCLQRVNIRPQRVARISLRTLRKSALVRSSSLRPKYKQKDSPDGESFCIIAQLRRLRSGTGVPTNKSEVRRKCLAGISRDRRGIRYSLATRSTYDRPCRTTSAFVQRLLSCCGKGAFSCNIVSEHVGRRSLVANLIACACIALFSEIGILQMHVGSC